MTQEITVKKTFDLQKPDEMTKLSLALQDHIHKYKLSVEIAKKNYVLVEGWAFAGGMMGLVPKIVKVEKIAGDEIKWLAECNIVNMKTGEVVGTGYALCSKKESRKSSFDEYAVLSMAQTRAIGKAYRNLIGWVMKMGGYEATPAEEISNQDQKTKEIDLDDVLKKINAIRNMDVLIETDEKIKTSKKYNEEQKKIIHETINKKIQSFEK